MTSQPSNWRTRISDLLFSGNRATIDAIRMAPPPSPLAPVDLSDPTKITEVMDLAVRVADLLLAAGTGNSDAKAQVQAITGAYGLHYTHVDITLNTVTVYAKFDDYLPPTSVFRVVHKLTTDYSRLTELDRLVRSIVRGATPLEEARAILTQIENASLPFRNRYALAAWALFAGAVALMLGGGWAVALVASFTTLIIVTANAWLASKSLPMFFQNALGGMLAVIPAGISYTLADQLGWYLPPSLVIASCIVALLAGLQLVQALEDGITGAPVTASARFFETILLTGGIIGGIAAGIQLLSSIGFALPALGSPQTTGILGSPPIQIISGALATILFALANFCERRATLVAGLTALAASLIFFVITEIFHGSVMFANAAAALTVGLTGGVLSRRYLIPPQITSTTAIMPFLPGLSLYKGMAYMLDDQFIAGISNLGLAMAIATTLAAGVVLGEWIARRIRRPRRIVDSAGRLLRPMFRSTSTNDEDLQFWTTKTNRRSRSLWAWQPENDVDTSND